ncbi:MAG: hypothetical protein U9N30_11195 [Campylobacterota bacterium]|nr:hypothetical protein [Campylobacterota bacterium]
MVVERFSQGVINSGLMRLYVATGFFATLIFFVVNADIFTPLEMIGGVIAATVIFKSIGNVMLSLIISLFSLDNKEAQLDYQYNREKIDAMLSELTVQDAQKSNGKK